MEKYDLIWEMKRVVCYISFDGLSLQMKYDFSTRVLLSSNLGKPAVQYKKDYDKALCIGKVNLAVD